MVEGTQAPPIRVDTQDGVSTVTICRPERRNALDTPTWRALAVAFERAFAEDDTRVVVLTGQGGTFTAGQDLREMAALTGSHGEVASEEHGFITCMRALTALDKPLVAAVEGVGVGFGFTVLLHCDVVVMAEDARLWPPFVALGLVPEAGASALLPDLVGHQAAAEILYTAQWLDAARVRSLGLAGHVVPSGDALSSAQAIAREIAGQPPEAVRHTKRLLLAARADRMEAARAREDEAFAERVGSAENLAALAAFARGGGPRKR